MPLNKAILFCLEKPPPNQCTSQAVKEWEYTITLFGKVGAPRRVLLKFLSIVSSTNTLKFVNLSNVFEPSPAAVTKCF